MPRGFRVIFAESARVSDRLFRPGTLTAGDSECTGRSDDGGINGKNCFKFASFVFIAAGSSRSVTDSVSLRLIVTTVKPESLANAEEEIER